MVPGHDRYEAQFAESFLSHPPKTQSPERLRRTWGILLACALVELAGGAFSLTAQLVVGPDSAFSLSPAILMLLVGAGQIWISLYGSRRLRDAARLGELTAIPPYAFAVTPTSVDFPGTMHMAATSWDRSRTVVAITGDGSTQRLKMSCRGHRRRRFSATVLNDSLDDLAARISRPDGDPRP